MVAWYLTKKGRQKFGEMATERDREWWKDAKIWVGVEDDHNPVMVEACENILRQCPGWGDVLREYAQSRDESAWRGVDTDRDIPHWEKLDFDHLRNLEVEAVIAEARDVLRERDGELTAGL